MVARGPDLQGGRNADLILALAVALWWADDLTWDYDPTDRGRPRRNLGEYAWMM